MEMSVWGDAVPNWLAGIGTVGTAAVTVFLLAREQGDRKARAVEAAKRLDHERRSQARLVTLTTPIVVASGGQKGSYLHVTYQAVLTNNSDDVISAVRAQLVFAPGDVLLDGELVGEDAWERVMPGDHVVVKRGYKIAWNDADEGAAPHGILASCAFSDAAGVRWRRDEDHSLSEAKK